MVREYIRNQEKEDKRLEQLNLDWSIGKAPQDVLELNPLPLPTFGQSVQAALRVKFLALTKIALSESLRVEYKLRITCTGPDAQK